MGTPGRRKICGYSEQFKADGSSVKPVARCDRARRCRRTGHSPAYAVTLATVGALGGAHDQGCQARCRSRSRAEASDLGYLDIREDDNVNEAQFAHWVIGSWSRL